MEQPITSIADIAAQLEGAEFGDPHVTHKSLKKSWDHLLKLR
jgi:hypothetical protein